MRKHCGNCANHKKETNQFSEECGKCVSARLANGETTDPSHWREKPQTNADRIRAMSDEELYDLLKEAYNTGCDDATAYEWGSIKYSFEWTEEWLKQPAE